MMSKFNKYHMVTVSPWPILASFQTQATMTQTVLSMAMKKNWAQNMVSTMVLLLIPTIWWANTKTESNQEGCHQKSTIKSMKISMLMFIVSEVLFFLSFFWAYFHSSSSPNIEMGQKWPPLLISTFNPLNVPMLNTIILVSSGFSVTWAHHLMLENKQDKTKKMLMLTCVLGVYFSILQGMEYKQSMFSMPDSSYGTVFFMATGFHGFHVLVGTSFLMVNLSMINKKTVTEKRHMGFEMAAWYWHFVDIVWLFLYLSIYWWGK